jgi:lysine 6-dehydrogenase
MKYLIIGSGRMAMGVVHDLLSLESTSDVHVTDKAGVALKEMNLRFQDDRLHTYNMDADDRDQLWPLLEQVDGVLSAVPYDYNLRLTEWAIENKCHFVDLGGNFRVVENQFKLSQKAKNAGVGVIPDCGLAPGMASVVAAHAIGNFDKVESLEIRVGGLPVDPKTPLNYRLIFSVHGLTNEYIEPSIILENGKIKTVPSMTEVESLDFPQPFGKLEAFYTSGGTSTLPMTYKNDISTLNYKTIRYPGHCEKFKMMIDLGFTDEESMDIRGLTVSRREAFERLLEETLTIDGEDVTLMRVSARGLKDGAEKRMDYQAIEYEDKKNDLSAMMRTTAFPAIITLEMLVDGRIRDKGVLSQELSIPPGLFLEELEKRNIKFDVNKQSL